MNISFSWYGQIIRHEDIHNHGKFLLLVSKWIDLFATLPSYSILLCTYDISHVILKGKFWYGYSVISNNRLIFMVENYSLVDILREISPSQMRDFVLFLGISIPNVCSASKVESQKVYSTTHNRFCFITRIRHFPIEATDDNKLAIGKLTFPNLMEIVTYYKEKPLFFSERKEPIYLVECLLKENVPGY